MKKFTLSAIILCAAIFASCKDNSTNPDSSCSLENSLKLQTGNYWIYNTIKTTIRGGDILGTSLVTDSTVVEGTRIIAGKLAYILTSHSPLNNSVPDTMYYAIEEKKVYRLLNSILPLSEVNDCSCFPVKWVLFADCSTLEWKAVDTTSSRNTYKVVNPNGTVGETTVQWHYLADGFSKGVQTTKIADYTVQASLFEMKGVFTFSIISPDSAYFETNKPGMRDLPLKVANSIWLSDGIGIVQYISEGYDKFSGPTPIVNGIRKTLVRYSVK